jgi:hypothetical protein
MTPTVPVAKFTACVIDNGDKFFATGVAKFTAGVIDTSGKFFATGVVHTGDAP